MYEERRDSFSIRDLILQVLFIILFVFILILIFPTKNYMKKYIGENKNKTVVQEGYDLEQLAVLYNQIFANNIIIMKEASVGYYTNERLPQKVGSIEKMTLQQMYDQHLVTTLTDKNGDSCDTTKSYVSVKRYDDEFQMKINLSCGNEEDYIIVYLGSYDYCDVLDICEKQTKTTAIKESTPTTNNNKSTNTNVTKYICEYKKVIGGSWGKYGAWSEWTPVKITESDNTQVETKLEKLVTGYTTKKVQTGTKIETYISGYTTSKYISGYTTEKYISGYTTEKYISGYTTNQIPVYSTRQVAVYSLRQVPVYSLKQVPVYATKSVAVYDEIKVAVYSIKTYYRSRTKAYTGDSEIIKWSACEPVDTSLTNNGYYLTGNVKKVN